jgi:hypothetical protein
MSICVSSSTATVACQLSVIGTVEKHMDGARKAQTFLPLDVVRTLSVRPIEMLLSPAYRALSLAAHKVIARVEIALAHNWGYSNGRLQVTNDQFVEYGLSRNAVAPAIREAAALGFISVNDYGEFGLTYCGKRGMNPDPPTNDWHRIETTKAAERIAAKARTAKSVRRSRRPPDEPVAKPSHPPPGVGTWRNR